jgi:hypothetical protein
VGSFLTVFTYIILSFLISISIGLLLFKNRQKQSAFNQTRLPKYSKKMAIKIGIVSLVYISLVPLIGSFISDYRNIEAYFKLVLITTIIIAFAFTLFSVQNSGNDE